MISTYFILEICIVTFLENKCGSNDMGNTTAVCSFWNFLFSEQSCILYQVQINEKIFFEKVGEQTRRGLLPLSTKIMTFNL